MHLLMKHTFFILIFLSVLPLCHAQRLPSWMNELPIPGNGTYMYVRESGLGPTLTEAYNQALLRVMQSTANRLGRPFDVQAVDFALTHSSEYQSVSRQYNIPINKVEQYDEQLSDGTYRVWILCQVAVSAIVQPQWDALRREGEASNWTALAKSAFLPGLGQMGKGYFAEGVLTLTGELLFVGGGIYSYLSAQQKLQKMNADGISYAEWNTARSDYSTFQTLSYISWGGVALLYAFNLYRSFSMQPRRTSGLALVPSTIPSHFSLSPSLSLTFIF